MIADSCMVQQALFLTIWFIVFLFVEMTEEPDGLAFKRPFSRSHFRSSFHLPENADTSYKSDNRVSYLVMNLLVCCNGSSAVQDSSFFPLSSMTNSSMGWLACSSHNEVGVKRTS